MPYIPENNIYIVKQMDRVRFIRLAGLFGNLKGFLGIKKPRQVWTLGRGFYKHKDSRQCVYMRKFTLLGLNRQTFDFNRSQVDQMESFDVIAITEREALIIGRKTHACTIAAIRDIK